MRLPIKRWWTLLPMVYASFQVRNRGLADPSYFEPDVKMGDNSEDRFYALIYERFWDSMLPALEEVWRPSMRGLDPVTARDPGPE